MPRRSRLRVYAGARKYEGEHSEKLHVYRLVFSPLSRVRTDSRTHRRGRIHFQQPSVEQKGSRVIPPSSVNLPHVFAQRGQLRRLRKSLRHDRCQAGSNSRRNYGPTKEGSSGLWCQALNVDVARGHTKADRRPRRQEQKRCHFRSVQARRRRSRKEGLWGAAGAREETASRQPEPPPKFDAVTCYV